MLNYANAAATAQQRQQLRKLAGRCLPPVHCSQEVAKIMGWA